MSSGNLESGPGVIFPGRSTRQTPSGVVIASRCLNYSAPACETGLQARTQSGDLNLTQRFIFTVVRRKDVAFQGLCTAPARQIGMLSRTQSDFARFRFSVVLRRSSVISGFADTHRQCIISRSAHLANLSHKNARRTHRFDTFRLLFVVLSLRLHRAGIIPGPERRGH